MDYSGAVLISVYEKEGVENVATLFAEKGAEIYSTGGTSRYLQDFNIPVTDVSEMTGFPEILDGRVKTLHPNVFGGILANRSKNDHMDQLDAHGLKPIIAVIVNFYPFEKVVAEPDVSMEMAIENIDIGGPSMLRAAAKNHAHVLPVCSQGQYEVVAEAIKNNSIDELRVPFAAEAFQYTVAYEQHIAGYFGTHLSASTDETVFTPRQSMDLSQVLPLRYGENPHQQASYYELTGAQSFGLEQRQLHGKPLSYNNLLDLDAAVRIIGEFSETGCVLIKHTNPCGFALGENPEQAYRAAVTTDPVSYYGGIAGFNREVDKPTAEALTESFLECVAAPCYTEDALAILQTKKNLRIVECELQDLVEPGFEIRASLSGFLLQERDPVIGQLDEYEIVTDREPNDEELQAMLLGWRLVKHTKSNAIVFTDSSQALGVGAGQMSRVDSVKIAVRKASEAGLSLDGASMSSDAFFPFPDGLEVAAEAGIKSVIQPGGSIRDEKVIAAANELGVAMIFTGKRHFKH